MKPILYLGGAFLLIAGSTFFFSRDIESPSGASVASSGAYEKLRFSNTMQWDPTIAAKLSEPLFLLKNWENEIKIPDPNGNDSDSTKRELQELIEYKKLRSQKKIEEIKSELELYTNEFGGRPMKDYFDIRKFPNTAPVLDIAYRDVTIITLKLKEKFDRVRPNVLSPDIDPIIDVPGHPAYPSGHSTQTHFLAYFLGELQPEKRAELERRAMEIAVNREIAGVHYHSDTEAGKLLAQQLFALLKQDPKFQQMFQAAKRDW